MTNRFPSDDPIEDSDALERYIAGDATPAEAESVEAELAARPAMRDAVRALQTIIAERRGKLEGPSKRPAVALADVRARVSAKASRRITRAVAVAASLALIVGAGWLVSRNATPAAAPRLSQSIAYVTKPGEVRKIELTDGTVVTLAPESHLAVTGFSSSGRVVELAGEAYFAVAHDTSRPFRVRARLAETTVLGTEFAVKAYPADSVATVVVQKGRVAVAARETLDTIRGRSVLTHDMLGQVTRRAVHVEHVDASRYLGWTHGELAFINQPLADVLTSLERWYGVSVDAAPALRDRRVEVTFTRQTFDAVMAELALALRARVTHISGTHYRLEPAAR